MIVSPVVLAIAHRVLPLFDASPRLQPPSSPHVRWDALHFLAIADAGYKYENQWAFLPGVPFLINLLRFQSNPYIWPIVLLAVAADSARILYCLTRLHFPASPAIARLVVLLSLFPSSPATLYLAPYAEPFFTCLSYRGMFYAAQHHWIRATLCFVLATFFRSNGVLLAGYLVWGLVVQPFIDRKQLSFFKMAYSIVLSACVAAPFIYHNYKAYRLFCNTPNKPQWCYRIPPSIYTHVQATYWDVGFLRYWTPAQIPNFVIAAPPLVLLIAFSVQHIKTYFLGFRTRFNGVKENDREENLFATPSITPYLIHSLAMCITFIFFSHTQIVLRLAAALPALYWAVGWLFVRRSPWAKIWIWWSVLWGLISLGLWTAFLPPA
ncbi:hypothetical protein H2248_009692 [Termitomyces sp. 'cryptogamus']|nr:hypothetical protein H2248_009692 [Termitomyces sp. 'cryptogamus']